GEHLGGGRGRVGAEERYPAGRLVHYIPPAKYGSDVRHQGRSNPPTHSLPKSGHHYAEGTVAGGSRPPRLRLCHGRRVRRPAGHVSPDTHEFPGCYRAPAARLRPGPRPRGDVEERPVTRPAVVD